MRNIGEDKYESFMSLDNAIDVMNDNIVALKSQTINLQENIEKTKIDPEKIFNELREKKIIYDKNREIIQDKMKILEGRNRMLQISMDKNIFSKKVVYILLTIIISIILIILFGISFFKSN
jgi:adenylosuccinate lyase